MPIDAKRMVITGDRSCNMGGGQFIAAGGARANPGATQGAMLTTA